MLKNGRDNKRMKLSSIFTLLIAAFYIFISGCTYKVGMKNGNDIETTLLSKEKAGNADDNGLQLQRKIELLDFDKNAANEYIEFKNKFNEYAGYVIRDIHSGYIYDFSNEGNLFEGLLAKSGLTYEDVDEGKVYFVNPFEIYVELNDGRIMDLMPKSCTYPSEITKEQLEKAFSERKVEFGKALNSELKNIEVSNSVLSRRASFTPCTADDFINLKITDSKGRRVYPHDHCDPTAATTIIKYFQYLGKLSLSGSYSNNDLFAMFYSAMDTNGDVSGLKDSGTKMSEIAPAYKKVGKDLGAEPKECFKLRDTSYEMMVNALDGGNLLHVSIDSFETSEGHSIAAVSYSYGYFKIADGWNSYFRNVSYSDMSVKQVIAVKY